MTVTAPAPWERLEGKIQPWHLDRLAVVYVRQSTPQQVLDHAESTRLQYGLTQRAVDLGWAPSRVLVIDEDLGQPASGLVGRPGFQRLVSEVGMDHVGLVLGVEMSRLARNGPEWHQLLELCALAGDLLADPDGVYDPAEHNDRLLLGLKGTISEAELHLIKQRMWNGRIGKARRGELAMPLPVGYVRLPDGQVVKDPDEQVQAVVHLVFDLFDELALINGVLRFLVHHGIQIGIRARQGPEKGQLVWRRPSRIMIQNMLRHPAYAGIYVYGRSRTDPRRRIPGRPFTGRVRKPRENWYVYLPGVLPAYIGMDRHERNLARIEANRARSLSMGALRDGPALLVGLIHCGRCGTRMAVHYQRGRGSKLWPKYECGRLKSDYGGELCQQLAGACLDQYITGLLLAAMAPAALEISLAAAGQAQQRREEVERIWRQRLERADYAVDRARRQYQLAEPENRLVVRELERTWEQALTERQQLGEEHDRFTTTRPRVLTAEEREQIRALAHDLPAIWHAPTTTDADRKQLMRHLIEKVTVTVIGDSERVTVQITWAGGHETDGEVARPVARLDQLSYFPPTRGPGPGTGPGRATGHGDRSRSQRRTSPPAQTHRGVQRDRRPRTPAADRLRQRTTPPPPSRTPTRPARMVAQRPRPAHPHPPRHALRLDQTRLGHRPPVRRTPTAMDRPGRPRRTRTTPPPAPAVTRPPIAASLARPPTDSDTAPQRRNPKR
ncbi:recombinase family protein [Streptomyces olivoreticuli]